MDKDIAKKIARQTGKLISRIAENLPDMDFELRDKWIQNPKALRKAIRKALCLPDPVPKFNVWRTLKLGVGPKDATSFKEALRQGGWKLSEHAEQMIDGCGFKVSSEEMEVDLVNVSIKELGFEGYAEVEHAYQRADDLGLGICPFDVGLQLALQHNDQLEGLDFMIGMEPLHTDSKYGPYIFNLHHVSRKSQDGYAGVKSISDEGLTTRDYFHDFDYIVFVKPRK